MSGWSKISNSRFIRTPVESKRKVRMSIPAGLFAALALVLFMASGGQPAYAQTQVWDAQLTVGVNDQLTYDYLGYLNLDDERWEDAGSLSQDTFAIDSEIYTISAICHPDFTGDNHYLFFLVDKPLPGNAFLEVGTEQYLISDASSYGATDSYYLWRLDASPGWVEGEIKNVFFVVN